jgi:hypothetical protein
MTGESPSGDLIADRAAPPATGPSGLTLMKAGG